MFNIRIIQMKNDSLYNNINILPKVKTNTNIPRVEII